jgi:hypothetical protein
MVHYCSEPFISDTLFIEGSEKLNPTQTGKTMLEIILFSSVLSPIVTAGLYVFFSGPATAPRHRATR